MGALHEGHLALIRRAGPLASPLVISIFVNPKQFGPEEDLQRYPRTLDADLVAARELGVDVVFAPDVGTIYPPDEDVPVTNLPDVATRPGLEDLCRPGHLAGVFEVVARLFDLVRPSIAVFGEKDYQQLLVVRALVKHSADRWKGLRIVSHPTFREPDGLAMSSRNASLDPQQRDRALGVFKALRQAVDTIHGGGRPAEAEQAMRHILAGHGLVTEYAVVRDALTLEPLSDPGDPARALVAARAGDVRLIDNMEVG